MLLALSQNDGKYCALLKLIFKWQMPNNFFDALRNCSLAHINHNHILEFGRFFVNDTSSVFSTRLTSCAVTFNTEREWCFQCENKRWLFNTLEKIIYLR